MEPEDILLPEQVRVLHDAVPYVRERVLARNWTDDPARAYVVLDPRLRDDDHAPLFTRQAWNRLMSRLDRGWRRGEHGLDAELISARIAAARPARVWRGTGDAPRTPWLKVSADGEVLLEVHLPVEGRSGREVLRAPLDDWYGYPGPGEVVPATRGPLRQSRPSGPPARGRDAGLELQRTPHLAVPTRVSAGATFAAELRLDEARFTRGEAGDRTSVRLDRGATSVDLTVRFLVSDELELVDGAAAMLTVSVDEPVSDAVTATIRARRATKGAPARVTAVLEHRGRPAGRVERDVAVAPVRTGTGGAPPPDVPADPPPPGGDGDGNGATPQVEVHTDALVPDITVFVTQDKDVAGSFQYRVVSPHRTDPALDEYRPWRTAPEPAAEMRRLFQRFEQTDLSPQLRHDELLGVGAALFRYAPPRFQELYWSLVDEDVWVNTISVVSDDPHTPWELMVPARDAAPPGRPRELDSPLGVRHVVARWGHRGSTPPQPGVSFEAGIVVVPERAPGVPLPHSIDEARTLEQRHGGHWIRPTGWTDFVAACRQRPDAPLIHIACHGSHTGGGVPTLHLDHPDELTPNALSGNPEVRAMVRAARPLVFLNACEAATAAPMLGADVGFVDAFVHLDAGAVIAPLWRVDDAVAGNVARQVYEQATKDPKRAIADILRELRGRAYADPATPHSYAAYCFHGDPFASLDAR